MQLTKFRKVDTFPGFVNPARTEAFFLSSADPFGTNPYGNCQIFSVGTEGGRLRQVTKFLNKTGIREPFAGCFDFGSLAGTCGIAYGYYRVLFQDPVTKAIVFDSNCDPLGVNPSGVSQLFAIGPKGLGLRQLTAAAGLTNDADGSLRAELPGPFAYSAAPH